VYKHLENFKVRDQGEKDVSKYKAKKLNGYLTLAT
jgi:hypothetical protein